jgi:glycosyltransferase involved in cell wall biosynthesis
VARRHPDWRLVIYGEGEQRPVLEKLVADHGLGESVSLPGRTDRIGEEFSRAAAFVLSSRREGLPMVILEAMSKGLPVVSFDCPTGPAELITADNGILVPDADVDALSRALCDVIEDDELRRRLDRGAVDTAARYDLDVIGRDWAALVDELLAETAPRPADVTATRSGGGPGVAR